MTAGDSTMHEASIVGSLLSMVGGLVPAHQRVQHIHVRVGGFTGVSPDAMQFYFEVLRDNTVGRQAGLTVLLEPLRAKCHECGQEAQFREPQWTCPRCGNPSLFYLNGTELDLVAVAVEDDGNYPDRKEDSCEE